MSNEQKPKKSIYLQGHTCKENAFKVDNYPWSFRLKTSIFYWIETKKGNGDRFCHYTINPKNGRKCAPKYSTYSTFMYMYTDEQGHVKHGVIDAYDLETFVARFVFIKNKLDVLYITDTQCNNLRNNYLTHIAVNAPYEMKNYPPEKQEIFKTWLTKTIRHIRTCDFTELVNHDLQPDYNNTEQF